MSWAAVIHEFLKQRRCALCRARGVPLFPLQLGDRPVRVCAGCKRGYGSPRTRPR